MVTRRGEFAVRGGILDVFTPTAEHAVRVDFFGDEVDQIRHFSVSDQRSAGEPIASLELWPARELLLTADVRERVRFDGHRSVCKRCGLSQPADYRRRPLFGRWRRR